MNACTALLELFKVSYEWRAFFRLCCERSAVSMRSQAWQFRDELKDRGKRFETNEVEDALPSLARELLPDSPAAQWDVEWAHELCKDALTRLAKAYLGLSAAKKDALDLSAHDVWDERMCAAGQDNDLVAFWASLRCWERAGLNALRRVHVRGGAA
jgi:hypothetical protein